MSRRVFYIIHLDKTRIFSLFVIGAGLLLTAFATGYRLAGPGSLVSLPGMNRKQEVSSRDAAGEKIDNTSEPTSREDQSSPPKETSKEAGLDDRDQPLLAAKDATRHEPATGNSQPEHVNLLDSALPPDGKDLKPYRKINPDADEIKDEASQGKKPSRKLQKKERSGKADRKKESEHRERTKKKKKAPAKEADNEASPSSSDRAKEGLAKKELYVLQLGAYQSRPAALRLAEQLGKQGVPAHVIKIGNIHAVRTEKKGDLEEMATLEKKLRSLNFSPVNVRLKNQ